MQRLKSLLIIIIAIILLNILLISVCNGLIEDSCWKYSHGADFKDFIEFNEKIKVKSILIQSEGKTNKIILGFLFDYMIICNTDFTNLTYYARKGKKYDPDNTTNLQQQPTEITRTPDDKKLLDSLMKNRK